MYAAAGIALVTGLVALTESAHADWRNPVIRDRHSLSLRANVASFLLPPSDPGTRRMTIYYRLRPNASLPTLPFARRVTDDQIILEPEEDDSLATAYGGTLGYRYALLKNHAVGLGFITDGVVATGSDQSFAGLYSGIDARLAFLVVRTFVGYTAYTREICVDYASLGLACEDPEGLTFGVGAGVEIPLAEDSLGELNLVAAADLLAPSNLSRVRAPVVFGIGVSHSL